MEKRCSDCMEWDGEVCENENSPHHDKVVNANHSCHKIVTEEESCQE